MKTRLKTLCAIAAITMGLSGALMTPAVAQTPAPTTAPSGTSPAELKHDIHELDRARNECKHIRETLKRMHDTYGMSGDWGRSEAALTQLEGDIDAAKGAVHGQIRQGK